MNDIPLRIKELMDYKKMKTAPFERTIGVGNNSIGTIIKRNSNVSGDILSKILITFLDVNPDWLLTGKGEMLRTGENLPNNPELQLENQRLKEENSELKSKLVACQEEIILLMRGGAKSKAS